jgi:hypothetical protein
MKTAVQWLEEEITNRIVRRNPHDTIVIQTQGEVLIDLFNQAKEIERQQITEAFDKGWKRANDTIDRAYSTSEDFGDNHYNETYNND